MRYLCFFFLFVPLVALGCEYRDDPRLAIAEMPLLVEAIISGDSVPPVSVRLGTYLLMDDHSRALLEPHLEIFDAICAPVAFFEGELLSRAVIPFEEFYRVMAYAIQENKPELAKQLFSRVRVAPKTVSEVQELFGLLPYKGAFGVQVRDLMQTIFPMYRQLSPSDADLRDPLKDGRLQDYAMIKLFRVFGGELKLDHSCGPYGLDENFYQRERVDGFFGEREVLLVRREPVVHLMQTMGYQVVREDQITFRIKNCST